MAATGVATAIEVFASKSMELKWVKRRRITKTTHKQKTLSTPLLPLFISTNPHHLNPHHLQNLCSICNHSFNRFPNLNISDTPETVDINKLRIALSHSDVLVSVFCKPHHVDGLDKSLSSFVDFFTPVSPERDLLVGFGRAVSDFGLTASIYDVMVIPSLRRMGIGKMIVRKIVRYVNTFCLSSVMIQCMVPELDTHFQYATQKIEPFADEIEPFGVGHLTRHQLEALVLHRMLTNRDIYDIAALCSEDERLFFKACGFGGDILDATTMMYTRTVSSAIQESEQTVTPAGRKLLLVPPLIGRLENPQGR